MSTDTTGPEEPDDAPLEERVLARLKAMQPTASSRWVWRIVGLLLLAAGLVLGVSWAWPACDAGSPAVAPPTESAVEATQYTCGMHPEIVQDEPGSCPVCGMKLTPTKPEATKRKKRVTGEQACKGREILMYQAPMDPNYTSPSPGKSPMGMDLVPVCESDQLEAKGSISIDSRVRQNMGIRTDTAVLAPLTKTIRTLGHVDFDERRVMVITTKIDGWVREMHVDFTGETVKEGDPLFSIDSPQLVSTQQELLSARRAFERTGSQADRVTLEATRQRLRYWDISPGQIEHIEMSGEVAQTLTIESPGAGVVVHKNALEGKFVRSDTELFRIADLSQVWVFAHFYEMDSPFVAVGAAATVHVPYDGRPPIEGTIEYVFPWLDAKTREVKARIALANPEGRLKPEMFVDVDLRVAVGDQGLLIDDSAVIRTGVRNVVFVENEPGSYTPRVIKLGRQLDGRVEITSGLQAGEKVVVKGQFMLDSESRLKEVLGKYEMDSESHEHGGAVEALEQRVEEGCSYTCPMPEHFHVCGQEPGPCPECGMAMQPIPTLLEQHRVQVEGAPPPPAAAPTPPAAPNEGAAHPHGGEP